MHYLLVINFYMCIMVIDKELNTNQGVKMFVYIVRHEHMYCFSTPRKAIEYAKNSDQYAPYIDGNEDLESKIGDYKTEKLITQLNKFGFITLYDGIDTIEIVKELVG